MATMDRDLDALDRALQAVKTRSANALVNEQSYISRIAQLEEVNRQLQAQLTVQTGLPTNAPANASEGSAIADGMKRSSSYMSMRTKSNHLVVAQLASDDGHGSDDSAGGAGEEHRAASAVAADRHSNDRSPPMPTIPTSHLRDDGTSATSSISSADSPSKVTFSRAPGLGVETLAAKLAAGATLTGPMDAHDEAPGRPNVVAAAAAARSSLSSPDRTTRRSMDASFQKPSSNGGLGGFEGRDGGEDYGTPRTHSVESLSMRSPGTGRGGFAAASDSSNSQSHQSQSHLSDAGQPGAGNRGGHEGSMASSQSGSDAGLGYLSREGTPGLPGGITLAQSAPTAVASIDNQRKVPFQLLLCNDDGCEVQEPADRSIRTRQRGMPHSQFSWKNRPRNVLVIKKPKDKNTTAMLPRVHAILQAKGIRTWVEPVVHWETGLGQTWEQDDDPNLDRLIDFIVCLGGDGTILWVSNLFPRAVPPVVSFAMGSLGFLTAFAEESIPKAIDDVVAGNFFFTMRSRLVAHVVHADGTEERERHVVLNEIVVDRGSRSQLIDLDVKVDGNPMTKVLADGVMISTPTGSTAYALAAGGSMVHPGVPGILFVPICPHTLSFRPLVLPDSVILTIQVPETARVEPVASFDGKQQRRLRRGESLVVAGWRYPVPAICHAGETGDWFRAVKDSLLWNVRGAFQKPPDDDDVEEEEE